MPPSWQAQKSISQERDRWFESGSLQRGVRFELDLGEGGFADEIAAAPAGGFATLDTTICRIADPTLVARPRQLRDASTVMVRSFGRD